MPDLFTPEEMACRTCFKVKPLTAFYKDSQYRFGVKNQCKACYRAGVRARYWEDPDKERIRKRQAHQRDKARKDRRRAV